MSNPDSQASESDSSPQESSPGRLLKAARLEQNQTQQEIAKGLFISEQKVEALEQDYYTPFSGRTYVRGYLLNYARILNLDSQPLLDAFNQIAPNRVVPVDRYKSTGELLALDGKHRQINFRLIFIISIVTLVIGFLVIKKSSIAESIESAALTANQITSKPVPPLVGPVPLIDINSSATQPKLPTVSQPFTTIAIARAPALAEPNPDIDSTIQVIAELKLTFAGQCWTDIRDAKGNKLHYNLQQADSEITLLITPPVKIFLGNAVDTKIFYNDKPYEFPFRGRIASFMLEQPHNNAGL
ncbi:MAG: DUF4115 domain-containing protein [Immundisolibacteraceae bacterium]|nr:DUF4115 domain-containing protein [Immundisolibacteraceae bacterium]